jgi:2-polyprenyl-3-methyl-5-hydroxy-6-metoxy-1,4-benzoquinol methylase
MSIGSRVRAMFGKHEPLVANLWRSMFLDLDDWTAKVRSWHPNPRRVLEVGCGEGYSTERLAHAFPDAEIVAIDIMPQVGRLYHGPKGRVEFRMQTAEDLAEREPGAFDLVIMCDVIHHVPEEIRTSVLGSVRTLLAPGGRFAVKDWARSITPIHWLCFGSDRWLTGDRVRFLKPNEARSLLAEVFGSEAVRSSGSVKPWRNNYAFLVQP